MKVSALVGMKLTISDETVAGRAEMVEAGFEVETRFLMELPSCRFENIFIGIYRPTWNLDRDL